jgi:hypothetical protein
MGTDDDKKDPTVRDLLAGESLDEIVDDATRKELERWFGLPSYEELEAKGVELPPEDPEIAAVRERRAKALEAIDPRLVDFIHTRYEDQAEKLLVFEAQIDVCVDPDISLLDRAMLEKVYTVGAPRDVERPEDLEDDLKDVTPQALLRDLHRPETDFALTFEMIDMAAAQRLDIVAEVDKAMRTSWRLPPLGRSPFVECRELVEDVRRERSLPWARLPQELQLKNRRVGT